MDTLQALAVEAADRRHLSPAESDSLTVEGEDSVRVHLDERDAAVSVVLGLAAAGSRRQRAERGAPGPPGQ